MAIYCNILRQVIDLVVLLASPYNEIAKGVIEIHSNERKQEMLKLLKSTTSAAPLTVSQLAQLLNVSERTVRYDLKNLEEELKKDGWLLCSQARCGIWLEKSEKTDEENRKIYVYTPKERRNRIVIALLTQHLSSVDKLAEYLDVSRGTLLSDLKLVQDFLQQRGLSYVAKRGYGIRAEGDELSIRDTLIHIFASDVYNFRNFAQADELDILQRPFRHYSKDVQVQKIADIFFDFVAQNRLHGTDMSMNRMVVALAVQLKRIRQGHIISNFDKMTFMSEEGHNLGLLSVGLAERLAALDDKFSLEGEQDVVLKELMHSRIYSDFATRTSGSLSVNEKALTLARNFIMDVQAWLGDDYVNDDELIYNLAMHLQPAIERAQCGISFSNPLLQDIRLNYKELFSICTNAARRITSDTCISFSEDEIGYLTVHIGAAVERRKQHKSKKLDVLLVCGNGIGMANLLELTLQNHLSYINIVRKISFYQLSDNSLEDIDLIISTMDLHLPNKAVLKISPILSESEIKVLENQIQYVYKKKYHNGLTELMDDHKPQRLWEMLSRPAVQLGAQAESWQDAVKMAGNLLHQVGAVERDYIQGMIRCIENFGSYSVICPGVAMPHARPEDGARAVAVSLIQLKEPVMFGNAGEMKPVDLIFAFSTTDEQAHLKMMLDLWMLFNDKGALDKLRRCNSYEEVMLIIRRCIEKHERREKDL